MNHALTASPVLQSFKVLWQWLMTKPGQPLPVATRLATTMPVSVSTPTGYSQTQKPQAEINVLRSVRPVRVLQVLESGQSSAQPGRLRISGRMADVCAELDRLAACEALQH